MKFISPINLLCVNHLMKVQFSHSLLLRGANNGQEKNDGYFQQITSSQKVRKAILNRELESSEPDSNPEFVNVMDSDITWPTIADDEELSILIQWKNKDLVKTTSVLMNDTRSQSSKRLSFSQLLQDKLDSFMNVENAENSLDVPVNALSKVTTNIGTFSNDAIFVGYDEINATVETNKASNDNYIDESVSVTMNLPSYGISAVKGLSKDLKSYNLKDHPAIEKIEIDTKASTMGFFDGLLTSELDEVAHTSSNQTSLSIANAKYNDFVPYSLDMVQSRQFDNNPSKNLKICVVDTGFSRGHVDLPNSNHGLNGWDAPQIYTGENWYADKSGHGTHVAGTISAVRNNKGLIGVNDDPSKFRFFVGQGLNRGGWGYNSVIMDAVSACVQKGSKVVNLSLGGPQYSSIQEAFYKDVYDAGVLIVAAAGNEGNSAPTYPASFPSVMSVAAVDSLKTRASFSSYNLQVEISAPGVKIASTYTNNRYAYMSGTSMASPLVAGVALKLWSWFPQCTNTQIRNVLLRTAENMASVGDCDNYYGYGIVRALHAKQLLETYGCEAGGMKTEGPYSNLALGGCNQLSTLQTTNPTQDPTTIPTVAPSAAPTSKPTFAPTKSPTKTPTDTPTVVPTDIPTQSPTATPTIAPSPAPTKNPTKTPIVTPTQSPTATPTMAPSPVPTFIPTKTPTTFSTASPTTAPSPRATGSPTKGVIENKSQNPSQTPSKESRLWEVTFNWSISFKNTEKNH